MLGKPAAFDFTVTSPLVSNSLPEASLLQRDASIAHPMMPNVLNMGWRCMAAGVQRSSGHYLSLLPESS